jgi:tRNA C32,U32 (ribose-2'-O)-methylase TrmJ
MPYEPEYLHSSPVNNLASGFTICSYFYWYSLNRTRNLKEIHTLVTELEDVQDILGSIHDSDTTIAYLKYVRQPNKVTNIFMTKFQKEIKKMRILSSFAKEIYLILDIISLIRSWFQHEKEYQFIY